MKVLHVHISDYYRGGGGAIATHRLHVGLRKAGVDSKIMCQTKTLESPHIIQIPKSRRVRKLETWLKKFTSNLGLNDIHIVSSFKLREHKAYQEADIFHLQGIHSGCLNYLALPSLTKDKPTIFTLHDIWPFTGHCAFSYDCERWQTGCGQCPYPEAYPPVKRDNTHLEWKLKNWVYSRSNMTVITLSHKLTEQAKQSMLNRFPIYQIPNGVDTKVYEPLDPEQCRSILGIPPGKKVLMVSALYLKQVNKGGDLLLKALQSLPQSLKSEVVLLTLGQSGDVLARAADVPTVNLGYVAHDRLKALAYSAADLFVFPSRAESFGLVALESMACGTPVVAFAVGGVPDLVRPGVTGYLAEPENAEDLCAGIVQLLEDKILYERMSQQGRTMALEEYTMELQVQQHLDLYHRLLSDGVAQAEETAMPLSKVTESV